MLRLSVLSSGRCLLLTHHLADHNTCVRCRSVASPPQMISLSSPQSDPEIQQKGCWPPLGLSLNSLAVLHGQECRKGKISWARVEF